MIIINSSSRFLDGFSTLQSLILPEEFTKIAWKVAAKAFSLL